MAWFNMSAEEYGEYVKKKSPNSKLGSDTVKAFVIGGLICCVGQGFIELFLACKMPMELAQNLECVTLVFLGAVLTGLGLYNKLGKIGGAGTLVPITGFANAVVSPALEFKTEGFVLGTAAKMFTIAGPVIVYGISASVIYGIILWIVSLFG